MGAQARDPGRKGPVRMGQRAGDAVVAVLTLQAGVVEAMVPRCLDDTDIEALHDLRVAIRRSRSVLRQMKQVLPSSSYGRHAADLRWVQAVTGPTRDLDVLLQRWPELLAAVPPEAEETAAPDRDRLVARRAEEFETMISAIDGPAFGERWSAWRSYLAEAPDSDRGAVPIEQLAGRRIERVNRRVRREIDRIGDTSPAATLHDLRKRGKELRYLLELFGETCLSGEVARLSVRRLKDLQDVLGRHQDDEVHSSLLRSLPERSSQMGALLSHLEADKREARQRLVGALDALLGPTSAVGSALGSL